MPIFIIGKENNYKKEKMGVAPQINKYICFTEVKSLISYAWKANKSFYLIVIKNITALLKFLFTYIISFG